MRSRLAALESIFFLSKISKRLHISEFARYSRTIANAYNDNKNVKKANYSIVIEFIPSAHNVQERTDQTIFIFLASVFSRDICVESR